MSRQLSCLFNIFMVIPKIIIAPHYWAVALVTMQGIHKRSVMRKTFSCHDDFMLFSDWLLCRIKRFIKNVWAIIGTGNIITVIKSEWQIFSKTPPTKFIMLSCPVWDASDKATTIHILHYSDVITRARASQNTRVAIAYSTVYSGADQRKHQSSASLAFVRGIHRWPVNSPHKGPVTRKMFPFDDVIMAHGRLTTKTS